MEQNSKSNKHQQLIEVLKLKELQEIKFKELFKRWWNGEEIGLREKTEFYHGRLFQHNYNIIIQEYLKHNSGEEYCYYLDKTVSAEAEERRRLRTKVKN